MRLLIFTEAFVVQVDYIFCVHCAEAAATVFL